MSATASKALAVFLILLGVVSLVIEAVLIAATWSMETGPAITPSLPSVGFLLSSVTALAAGSVLAYKRPGNLVGWLFLVLVVANNVDIGRYMLYSLEEPGSLPDISVAAGLIPATWSLGFMSVVFILLCFPQGRPQRGYWTALAWALAGFELIYLVVQTAQPGPLVEPFQSQKNQLGIRLAGDVEFLTYVCLSGSALIGLVAVINLGRRLLRTVGDEHEQLKWFAYVVLWVPPLVGIWIGLNVGGIYTGFAIDVLTTLLLIVLTSLPIAIGFAVLKYRLYDIDLLINRTLVYVPLTAILAGIFSASTALTRTLFTEISGQASDAAVAATTIAIVGLFTPVKNLLQSFVDRLFKEAADPAKPLLALSKDARRVFNLLDAEAFIQEFADKAAAAFGAVNAQVYLNGKSTPIVISGDATVQSVLTFPLLESGTHVGRLDIGPSRQSRPFTPAMVDAMEAQTDVLARGLVFYAAAMGLEIERPDQTGPGVVSSVSEELGVL